MCPKDHIPNFKDEYHQSALIQVISQTGGYK